MRNKAGWFAPSHALACEAVVRLQHVVTVAYSYLDVRTTPNQKEFLVKTKKKIVRREFSKQDVKELRAHSKAKTPVNKIAKLTKRTVGSLRQKALRLGFGLGHQR